MRSIKEVVKIGVNAICEFEGYEELTAIHLCAYSPKDLDAITQALNELDSTSTFGVAFRNKNTKGYSKNKHTHTKEITKQELEAAIYGMKDAIVKGDFVDIVLKEKIFIRYINLKYPCDMSNTDLNTMRRGSYFWLKELMDAIRKRDAIAMKRAYDEFVRLYVLMEGLDTTKASEEKKRIRGTLDKW